MGLGDRLANSVQLDITSIIDGIKAIYGVVVAVWSSTCYAGSCPAPSPPHDVIDASEGHN